MNFIMIKPILPNIFQSEFFSDISGITVICIVLSLFAAGCVGLFAAKRFGGNKVKTVLVFIGITGFIMFAMLCFFGCAVAMIRGIIFTLVLTFLSYSDLKTRECDDYLHLMIIIAAFIGMVLSELPYKILSAIAIGLIMLGTTLFGERSVGGADIKCCVACAFLLGFQRSLIGLMIGLLLAVIINIIRNRKNKHVGFPLIPYLAVGFITAYFL